MRAKTAASFDVVDDTTNQVYRGVDGIVPSLSSAAGATAGQVIAYGGAPADVWYHSACGGHTAASFEVTGGREIAYLRGTPDVERGGRAYCSISPYYTWRNSLSPAAVARVAGLDAKSVTSLSVADRWADGRARTVRVQTSDGAAHDADGHAFYARAGAVLGYKVVPSALFDVAQGTGGAYVLSGRGVGHGVGMCQWGAEGRARAGQNAGQILVAYFPGTTLTPVTP
jgi:stage II sporulation protein D